jgi:uncharacterized membrane protein
MRVSVNQARSRARFAGAVQFCVLIPGFVAFAFGECAAVCISKPQEP